MKNKFLAFLKERLTKDQQEKSIAYKEQAVEMRLKKMRDDAEYRIDMIEEFKKTLDNMEWNEKVREDVR
jgi:hypothetical protein